MSFHRFRSSKWTTIIGALCFAILYAAPCRGQGPASGQRDNAFVAVDLAGDAIVAGVTTDQPMLILKYSGKDGHAIWRRYFQGPGNNDYPAGLAADKHGDIILTARVLNPAGPNQNPKISDYVAKYSGRDGVILWEKIHDSPANYNFFPAALALDREGNAIVGGSLQYADSSDFRVVKYSTLDGTVLWETPSPRQGRNCLANALALDDGGNVFVTGYIHASGSYDFYTAKYAGDRGEMLWQTPLAEPQSNAQFTNAIPQGMARAIAIDPFGNPIVTGNRYNTSRQGFDYNTIKYNGDNGALLWQNHYEGAPNSSHLPRLAAADPAGNIFVTGSSTVYAGPPPYFSSYYTAKYAGADGTLLWQARSSSSSEFTEPTGLILDGKGGVFISGETHLRTTFDASLMKYDAATGSRVWDINYNAGSDGQEFARSLAIDSQGNAMITGGFQSPSGDSYGFTAKYAGSDGGELWSKGSISLRFIPNGDSYEGEKTYFRLQREGDLRAGFSVDYFTGSNGFSMPGINFVPKSGAVTFAPGEREKVIDVVTLNDGKANGGLIFDLWLTNATADVLITQDHASARILDVQFPVTFDWDFLPALSNTALFFPITQFSDRSLLVSVRRPDPTTGLYQSETRLLSADGTRSDLIALPSSFLPASASYGLAQSFYPLSSGKIILGGEFTQPDGKTLSGVGRFRLDGSADPDFTPFFPDQKTRELRAACAMPDGSVITVLGDRECAGCRNLLVRLLPNGRVDSSFAPEYINNEIAGILQDNERRILLCGNFDFVGHSSRTWVARLLPNGALDANFNPVLMGKDDCCVSDVAIQADGKILIAGGFTAVNGVRQPSLTRLNADGSLDTSFHYAGGDSRVWLLQLNGDVILAARDRFLDRLASNGSFLATASIPFRPQALLLSRSHDVVAFFRSERPSYLRRVLLDGTPQTAVALSVECCGYNPFYPFAASFETSESRSTRQSSVSLKFSRLGDVDKPASLRVKTQDGAAKAGVHYLPFDEILAFAPFEQEKEITLNILSGDQFDPDKTFTIHMTSLSGIEKVSPPLTIMIHDFQSAFLPSGIKLLPSGEIELHVYSGEHDVPLEVSSDLRSWSAPNQGDVTIFDDAETGPNRYRILDKGVPPNSMRFYRLKHQRP